LRANSSLFFLRNNNLGEGEVMGRAAKHNWKRFFAEFQHGEYKSLTEFAERKKISYDLLRKEFKKLGYKNGHHGTESGQIQPDKITGQNKEPDKKTLPPKKSPVGGRQHDENGLTAQQKLFVSEYLLDFNATRAAIAAGYSKRSAYSTGWDLIRKPAIQQELQRQTEGDISRLGLTRERQLLEYMRIAYANVGEYVEFGQREVPVMGPFGPIYEGKGKNKKPVMKVVNYIDFKSSEEVDSTLIGEVKQGKEGVSIKLHDKMKALGKLDKYLDLLPDHHRRRIEEEKLKIDRERLELEKKKVEQGSGPGQGDTWADLVAEDDDDDDDTEEY
jgi:phage terminase small subunit